MEFRKFEFKSGTDEQHNNYTGYAGEITFNTDRGCLHLHDGITAGGQPQIGLFALLNFDNTNTDINKIGCTVLLKSNINTALQMNYSGKWVVLSAWSANDTGNMDMSNVWDSFINLENPIIEQGFILAEAVAGKKHFAIIKRIK